MEKDKHIASENGYRIQRRDLFWIIGVLVTVVAILFGCLITQYDVDSILSTISTVVSVLLSIVAMFYSIVSNSDSQRINTATEVEIAKISQKIDTIDQKLEQLERLDRIAEQNYHSIKNAQDSLERVEEDIPKEKRQDFDEMKENMGLFLTSYERQLEDIRNDTSWLEK